MPAFAGSDLEVLLRARRSGHLVLAGVATSGVVFPRQAEVTTIADWADRLHHAASSVAQPPGQ